MTTEQAATLRAHAEKYIEHTRANRDLSGEAKTRRIARAYLDLKDGLSSLEAEANKATATRVAHLERKLFGIPNQADASSMISYRDAIDRAAQIKAEPPAISMLRKARTAGDDLLVRALLATAYENEWVGVINAFSEASPSTDADITELWERRHEQANFADYFEYVAGARPKEIASFSEPALRSMAADETPTSQIATYA